MVGYAFPEFAVTSWGPTGPDGLHVWRARNDQGFVEFRASRLAPVEELYHLGEQALADGSYLTERED